MILVGIDDTDSLDSRGTNKLAQALAARVADRFGCRMIVRHQLLFDLRIPFTSHNGSASLWLEPLGPLDLDWLHRELCAGMLSDFIDGSDPGLCIAEQVTPSVIEWGQRCQREIVTQAEARELVASCDVRLEGLGGTDGGVIGALAAIGLAATGDDGRIVQWGDWPDDLTGPTPVEHLIARGIEVRCLSADEATTLPRPTRRHGQLLTTGIVDVGKHMRANLREHHAVLFVARVVDGDIVALKLK